MDDPGGRRVRAHDRRGRADRARIVDARVRDRHGAAAAPAAPPRRRRRRPPPPVAKPDVDTDGDGIVDRLDKCPTDPEDKDGFEDEDGCPDPDNDKDGVPDVTDKCPNVPEDKDAFEDEDGCPDPDNDKDGILDTVDKCPNEPETFNGFEDDDGCPDKASLVVLTAEKIEIKQQINFATNKSTIKKDSFPLLAAVAKIMSLAPRDHEGARRGPHR